MAGFTRTTKQAALVICGDAADHVPVHEWGHTVGLDHRTDSSDALMWWQESGGTYKEINSTQRAQIDWSVWAAARWGW